MNTYTEATDEQTFSGFYNWEDLETAWECHFSTQGDEADEAFTVLESLWNGGIPLDPTPDWDSAVDYFASLYSMGEALDIHPESYVRSLVGRKYGNGKWLVIYVPGVSLSLWFESDFVFIPEGTSAVDYL